VSAPRATPGAWRGRSVGLLGTGHWWRSAPAALLTFSAPDSNVALGMKKTVNLDSTGNTFKRQIEELTTPIKRRLMANSAYRCQASRMTVANAVRYICVGAWHAVFKRPLRTLKGVGAAVRQGGPAVRPLSPWTQAWRFAHSAAWSGPECPPPRPARTAPGSCRYQSGTSWCQ
jgi:hypothetical protein